MSIPSPASDLGFSGGLRRYSGCGAYGRSSLQRFNGCAAKVRPSFMLQFTDAGSGLVSLAEAYTNATPTFTRATTAWTKLSTGLWAQVASGSARSMYSGFTTAAGNFIGYLAEGARTNSCLQSRDLSNASWTKTTATGAKDQAGIDGVGNSASSLLATAGNGTATQALTIASAAKTVSFWIKRITGTGTIQITLDNFATNTDVTALINASTYTLVTMTQTLANPTVGIKIVTSGDKIAVDMAGLEDSASFASTPIPTTVATVTRNADVLTYLTTGWYNTATGTLVTRATLPVLPSANSIIASINDGTNSNKIQNFVASSNLGQFMVVDATVTQANIALSAVSAGVSFTIASSWAANNYNSAKDGTLGTADVSGTIPAGLTTISIGEVAGFNQLWGAISYVRYYQPTLPSGVLAQQSS